MMETKQYVEDVLKTARNIVNQYDIEDTIKKYLIFDISFKLIEAAYDSNKIENNASFYVDSYNYLLNLKSKGDNFI